MAKQADVEHLGGKLSQLLAETILNAAPRIQKHVQDARAEANHDFLEGMEQHVADLVRPILESYTGNGHVPPELTKLLSELGVPTEQFTGIISQFFIFGVMFNVAGAMLSPFVQQIQNDVWSAHPDRPVSPADLATMTVRGIDWSSTADTEMIEANATEAKMSGFDAQQFQAMCDAVGMAPALQLLFEMIRRQIIPEGTLNGGGTTLISGIQQSDIKDMWIDSVAQLRYVQPTPIDMVAAAVRHQWDDLPDGVDLSQWADWATTLGLEPPAWLADNPNWFNILYNVSGRPLGPQEMGRLANRGQLPWTGTGSTVTSFQQGIAESDIKDKWEAAAVLLQQYWPAVGETGALLREGGLSVAQAQAYWQAEGVPAELATALLYVSQIQQVTQERALAKGDILQLVQENAVSDTDALEMLQEIGYTGDNAAFLLEGAHFRFELEAIRTSVRNVSTLYTGRKITATQAQAALQGIGMPADQIDALLSTLTNQRNAEVLIPTVAQMASALFYGVVDYATAEAFLMEQGYSADDAWLVLSVRMHGPITPAPSGVTIPTPAPVTPTTTT